MTRDDLSRRRFLARGAALAMPLATAACGDDLSRRQAVSDILAKADGLTYRVQRLLMSRRGLAPEFTEADVAPSFRANGSTDPDDADYRAHVATNFAQWRLAIGGLVRRPLSLSLAELRQWPARTQITRHDCVEGWSCIGKWTGARLAPLLDHAAPLPTARFVVFYCADGLGGPTQKYYESIDLEDAYHPQTILAYAMNDAPLPVKHGAPVRVRLERMLGYKMAKYIMRIALVGSFAGIGGGKGGFWEDRGYAWYAGI